MTDLAARPTPRTLQKALKPTVFVLCLLPLAWLAVRGVTGNLGANPIEAIIRYLGDWALRFLIIALAVTPLRRLTGWNALARLRRMLGLFAFAYVVLHLLAFVGLDRFFDLSAIWREIVKRKFITVGMIAFVMLVPLAITSTDAMVRRLGSRAWRRLHRMVYPAAILGVIHYFMMIKAGLQEPTIYAVILALLLASRLIRPKA